MSTNPVSYAEQELGVHDVYEQAQQEHSKLESALARYSGAASDIRSLNDRIGSREYEIASEVRGEKPDISQSALERAVKDARYGDEELRALNDQLRRAQDEQEQAHADIESSKYRLRYLSARLNELGGLLAFYGSAKNAAAQRRSKTADD